MRYLCGKATLSVIFDTIPKKAERSGLVSGRKKHVVEQITFLVEEKDVDPSEIYVLCGSVKYDWVKKIANEVCQKGIGVYFPQTDYSESDIKYTLGKVWFNTFHASKGRSKLRVCFKFWP